MREDNIRRLGRENPDERIHAVFVQLRCAVDLAREDRLRPEDLAGGLRFGAADGRGLVMRFAADARLAPRQVDDGDAMPSLGVARQRAAAAGFRIVRMAAHADDLQPAGGGRLAHGKPGKREGKHLAA